MLETKDNFQYESKNQSQTQQCKNGKRLDDLEKENLNCANISKF